MIAYWLLLPYFLLLPVCGTQFYMVEFGVDILHEKCGHKLASRLKKFRQNNMGWIWWLAREAKDWSLAGILAALALYFSDLSGLILWLLGLLSAALLFQTLFALTLLLFLHGIALPRFLLRLSVRLAIPQYQLANRRRALCWGILFLLAGLTTLQAWVICDRTGSLIFGFTACLLGFYSLLWAGTKWMEEKQPFAVKEG